MKGYIYKHTSPKGKSYIGQTTRERPELRWREGLGYMGHKKLFRYFSLAIKKYGWENFTHEILWEGEFSDISELNQLEEDYIIKFNTLVPNGYNLITGGKNKLVSEEVRNKMRKPKSPESIEKSAIKHRGTHWYNNGKINRVSLVCPEGFVRGRLPYDYSLQNEVCLRMAKANIGRKWYNNGVKEIMSHSQPEGFIKGRLVNKKK